MKRQNTQDSSIKELIEKIDKKLDSFERSIKVVDQKLQNNVTKLEVSIMSSSLRIQQRLESSFQAELQIEGRDIVEKIDKKITKFSDLILTTVDPLLKELETRQEEREIGANNDFETKQALKNHETRIKKLETVQQTP